MAKKKYRIGLLETHMQYVKVEAETAGEAVEKAMEADGDYMESVYLRSSEEGTAPSDYEGYLSEEEVASLLKMNDESDEEIPGLGEIICFDEEPKCSSN